jgi:hypothetical protein
MMVRETVVVLCAACRAECMTDQAITTRPVDVSGEAGVVEVGLACPHCGDWTHAYFETASVRRRRDALNRAVAVFQKQRTQSRLKAVRRAQRQYRAEFDETQARLRPLVGVLSPTAVLGEQVVDVPKDGG